MMTNRKELEVQDLMITHEITYNRNCIDTWKFRQAWFHEDWETAIEHAMSEVDRLTAEMAAIRAQCN